MTTLAPRQDEHDARRKRRRGSNDDIGRPPEARAEHTCKEDGSRTGKHETDECVVDGGRRSVGDHGDAISQDKHTGISTEAHDDVSPQLLVSSDVFGKSGVSVKLADAEDKEWIHDPRCGSSDDTARASAIPAIPVATNADHFIVKERNHVYKVSRVDAIEDMVGEPYDQYPEDHTGHYTSDYAYSMGDHNSDLVIPKRAMVWDADEPRDAHGGPSGASYALGSHHYDGGSDDHHDQYGLHECADHPFDFPPEDDELYGLHDGDDQPGSSGATSSGDPRPVTVQCDTRTSPLRRRLTGKTSPSRAAELGHAPRASGPHPVHELVTREAARAARLRLREATGIHEGCVKKARYTAWQAIRRQPELFSTSRDGDPAGGTTAELRESHDVGADDGHIPLRWRAHASHDVAAAPGAQIVYCRRCGAWTTGERSSNLIRECSLRQGHKGNLRLLSLGIMPRRGARVPPELKRAGARGSRGGTVVRRSKRRGAC